MGAVYYPYVAGLAFIELWYGRPTADFVQCWTLAMFPFLPAKTAGRAK